MKDKNILDIGSGGGWAAKSLIDKCKQFISVDISDINLRKQFDIINRDNYFPIQADALNLPFANNSIDIVIASEIIEHLVNPQTFIEEIYRILKPDGKAIISTPYKETLHYSLCIHCNKPTPKNAHLHSFDENKLYDLTKNCKNSTVKFHIFGNKVLHLGRSYIVLQYLPLKIWHLIDKLANIIINKKQHIIMEIMHLSG